MSSNESIRDDDLVVVGPAIRTSPERVMQDIPAFWQSFFAQGFLERLPRRPDDPSLYAVYCDYDGDWTGPYTMVIGVAIAPGAAAPEGTRRVLIPAGRYARFEVKGDPTKVLAETWRHICEEWPRRAQRRYAADFEQYGPAALQSMANGYVEADIVVGLRA